MSCKEVSVINELIFGGETLMGYQSHTNIQSTRANVIEPGIIRSNLRSDWVKPSSLIHLAAILDFTPVKPSHWVLADWFTLHLTAIMVYRPMVNRSTKIPLTLQSHYA